MGNFSNLYIDSVEYFYYDEKEKGLILSVLPKKMIVFRNVKDYWNKLVEWEGGV